MTLELPGQCPSDSLIKCVVNIYGKWPCSSLGRFPQFSLLMLVFQSQLKIALELLALGSFTQSSSTIRKPQALNMRIT